MKLSDKNKYFSPAKLSGRKTFTLASKFASIDTSVNSFFV